MSIPKEPRQLMINLMYLVLTALLALNVSAEVMNAFFTLDKGNKSSMATVDQQLGTTVEGLNSLLEDESKAKYRPITPAIEEVRTAVTSLNEYIDDLRDELIDMGGNNDGEVTEEGDFALSYGKMVPKGKKNKDITTRLLVGPDKNTPGKGKDLKKKVTDTATAMLAAYEKLMTENGETFGLQQPEIDKRVAAAKDNMTLGIDDESWVEAGKDSWSQFKFNHMPLAAVLPLLSKMQADAKTSEAALVNDMATLAGGRTIEFDAFFPVVQAKSSYIIKGDPFEAEVSVGSYSSQIKKENIKIYVNGSSIPINDEGKGTYKTTTRSTGKQSLKLRAEVTNPLTGETSKGEGSYDYEVGVRSVAVSADKMNVFYIGVDNPVSVSVAGASSNDVTARCSGCTMKGGRGKYVVTADRPGDAKVTVSGGGLPPTNFDFRVKRIPDPVAKLGNKADGSMGNGEFKAQGGVIAWLEGFDFDAKCKIQSFGLVRVPKREDPVESLNNGPRFNQKSKRLVNAAKPGDTYYFENVKARCPGDKAGRKINSMVFKIR